eukprot:TRINITY_DN15469_c0_g1_i1.p1 TRINITY_DN15469_c0_g1~~TRINITY_DN15469_c0_g1_i1.p1  ORF type:complete len:264 (-),score=59.70 TRINITY_DN15469_c0_g1_i1:60-851(-)
MHNHVHAPAERSKAALIVGIIGLIFSGVGWLTAVPSLSLVEYGLGIAITCGGLILFVVAWALLVASLARKTSTYPALTISGVVFNVLAFVGNAWTLTYPAIVAAYTCNPPTWDDVNWSYYDTQCGGSIAATAGAAVLLFGQVFMIASISLEHKRALRTLYFLPTINYPGQYNTTMYPPVYTATSESAPLMGAAPRNATVASWNVQQVAEWIRTLRISRDYSAVILQNQITGEVLSIMTDERWRRLGVVQGDVFLIEDALTRLH